MSSERNAPPIRSLNDGTRQITELIKSVEFASRGWRPFAFSFMFDDRRGDATGPITGTIWAKDAIEAADLCAVDSNGMNYGYDKVITPCPWSADSARRCATPDCQNDPGGNGYDEYLYCRICHDFNELKQSIAHATPITVDVTPIPVTIANGRHHVGFP